MKQTIILITLLLIGSMIYSQTILGGTFRNDTTLTATGNPYHVSSFITVPDSVTLTLGAGVNLVFGDAVSMEVFGAFISNGQPGNEVVLEDAAKRGMYPGWSGVRVFGKATIQYTHFVKGEPALEFGSFSTMSNQVSLVRHCTFDSSFV
ncbi:MAG: hypothetical protein AB8F95_15910, partial [Bacteroidia bacterium]